jgi:O-antigen ligase
MLVGAFLFLVGLQYLHRKHLRLRPVLVPAAFCFIIVFGITTVFIGKLPLLDISSSLGRNSTLTDRNIVWASLVPQAMHKPLTGHGFGGFWTPRSRVLYDIPNAHSGYLDVILSTGFIGLLLISVFMLISCAKAQKEFAQNHYWGSLWLCCLLMTMLNNIAESSLDSFTSLLMTIPLWFTVVLGTLGSKAQGADNRGSGGL